MSALHTLSDSPLFGPSTCVVFSLLQCGVLSTQRKVSFIHCPDAVHPRLATFSQSACSIERSLPSVSKQKEKNATRQQISPCSCLIAGLVFASWAFRQSLHPLPKSRKSLFQDKGVSDSHISHHIHILADLHFLQTSANPTHRLSKRLLS